MSDKPATSDKTSSRNNKRSLVSNVSDDKNIEDKKKDSSKHSLAAVIEHAKRKNIKRSMGSFQDKRFEEEVTNPVLDDEEVDDDGEKSG